MADTKVRVEKANAHYYPDILVSCGSGVQKIDLQTRAVEDSILIVEVLSTHTGATDRRETLLTSGIPHSAFAEGVCLDQPERREGGNPPPHSRVRLGKHRIRRVRGRGIRLSGSGLDMREIYEGVPIDALTLDPTQM